MYVIPKSKDARVKRFIRRMDHGVAVKHEHVIYGDKRVLGGPTNKDVHAKLAVERRWTQGVIDRYSRRMVIENSYKKIKDFLAWTTSKDYCVRLFHFAFAVLLYDIWLLTDLLVKKMLGCEQHEPRLKSTRFLNLLDQFLVPGD